MSQYTIAVLVNNHFGVLNRLTSMFRRRQFNITGMTASETESPAYSRLTFCFDGEDDSKQQLINQLYKLPDVCSITELNNDNSVNCELMLIKLKNDPVTRSDIMAAADAFDAKTMDYTKESIMFRVIGTHKTLDDFLVLMQDFTILEICRTGTASMHKGSSTLVQHINN